MATLILLASTLALPAASAQRITLMQVAEQSRSERDSADSPTISGSASIAAEFVELLLDPYELSTAYRRAMRDSLLAILRQGRVDTAKVRAVLRTKLDSATAAVLTDVLVSRVRDQPESPFALLSSATATGTTDRLYSTVEVFRYQDGGFSARVVTAVAVSNADTAVEDNDPDARGKTEDFQLRTAQLLSALQDGGPFATHLAYHLRKSGPASRRGIEAAVVVTVARSGTLEGTGGALGGSAVEIKAFSRREPPAPNVPPPLGVTGTLRVGYRYAAGGIVAGSSERQLLATQLVFEATAPFSKIPIGFTLTRVNGPFRPYAVSFQVFGMTGL